jgi:hypothetical protein
MACRRRSRGAGILCNLHNTTFCQAFFKNFSKKFFSWNPAQFCAICTMNSVQNVSKWYIYCARYTKTYLSSVFWKIFKNFFFCAICTKSGLVKGFRIKCLKNFSPTRLVLTNSLSRKNEQMFRGGSLTQLVKTNLNKKYDTFFVKRRLNPAQLVKTN